MPDQPTVLVTGASRGIGRAIARRLAPEWHVLAAARSEEELASLAREIEGAGGRCTPLVLDVTDADAVARTLDGVEADAVVNNAGIGIMKPLVDLAPSEWRRMMAVNLDGVYHVTRALLPGMLARRRGHVVNIASIAGRSAFPGGSGYVATKHALLGFSECLMLEVRDRGVRVSVILPGSVATAFSSSGGDQSWKLPPEGVADSVRHVLDAPPGVLVYSLEVRTLHPPPRH